MNAAADHAFEGAILGAVGVTKSGAATWTLRNTRLDGTGTLTVNAGALAYDAAGMTGRVGSVSVQGGTLRLAGGTTLSATNMTFSSTSTLAVTLTGTNATDCSRLRADAGIAFAGGSELQVMRPESLLPPKGAYWYIGSGTGLGTISAWSATTSSKSSPAHPTSSSCATFRPPPARSSSCADRPPCSLSRSSMAADQTRDRLKDGSRLTSTATHGTANAQESACQRQRPWTMRGEARGDDETEWPQNSSKGKQRTPPSCASCASSRPIDDLGVRRSVLPVGADLVSARCQGRDQLGPYMTFGLRHGLASGYHPPARRSRRQQSRT